MPFDSFLDWLFVALAFVPVFYLSIFGHELGHALMGWRNGFVITSFGMGLGKPFWVQSWRGARVYLGRKNPLQGITFFFVQQIFPSRSQLVAVLAGGILANLLLVLLALGLWLLLPHGTEVLLLVAVVNAVMAVTNLIPFSFKAGKATFRSDGLQILLALLGRSRALPPWQRIEQVRNLRELWESVGDQLGLSVHLLDAALAWRELGDLETADAWFTEAEALAGDQSPARRAFGALVRGSLAREGGQLSECQAALDEADELFRRLKHPAGLLLVAWERAELLRRTDVEGGIAALEHVARHPLVLARAPLRDALLVSRLLAHAAAPPSSGDNGPAVSGAPGALPTLRLEYDRLRRRQPSPTRDLRVFHALTRHHVVRREWNEAAEVCELALGAARQTYESIGAEADQVRFQQCQTDLLTEAAELFKGVGRADLAEKAQNFFSPPGTSQWRQQEKQARRNRLYLRVGLGVALGQFFLVLPGLLVLLRFMATRQSLVSLRFDAAWFVATIVLLLGSAVAALAALLLWLLAFWVPSLRHKGGATVFFLAIMPWLCLLGAGAIGFLDWLEGGW
jgi:tetratricopeptide (TPR) repeat protein